MNKSRKFSRYRKLYYPPLFTTAFSVDVIPISGTGRDAVSREQDNGSHCVQSAPIITITYKAFTAGSMYHGILK